MRPDLPTVSQLTAQRLCLSLALLILLPANALGDDDEHESSRHHEQQAPAVSIPPPAPPSAPPTSHDNNDYGLPSTSSSGSSSPPSDRIRNLDIQLTNYGYAAYWGIGLGKAMAYYPTFSDHAITNHIYLGARLRHVGVEFGLNDLGKVWPQTPQRIEIESQVRSLSLLGYAPVNDHVDLYARYGWQNWRVYTTFPGGMPSGPSVSGSDTMLGLGLEYRDGEYFLRLEKEVFRHVYQSSQYNYVGISIGGFFD